VRGQFAAERVTRHGEQLTHAALVRPRWLRPFRLCK
jgi:hypothetical protein